MFEAGAFSLFLFIDYIEVFNCYFSGAAINPLVGQGFSFMAVDVFLALVNY